MSEDRRQVYCGSCGYTAHRIGMPGVVECDGCGQIGHADYGPTPARSEAAGGERMARIKKIWDETPLCESAWCRVEEWLNEDTGVYEYRITNMCPIAALLKAAGVSDAKIRRLDSYLSTDDVYEEYESILMGQYGITDEMFDHIISTVDNLPLEYSNDEEVRKAAVAALEDPSLW